MVWQLCVSVWRRSCHFICFFNDTATTEIYTTRHTLSLHDALPISDVGRRHRSDIPQSSQIVGRHRRSEEHTSELQSRLVNSYAVFCLKKKNEEDAEENSIVILDTLTNILYNQLSHSLTDLYTLFALDLSVF